MENRNTFDLSDLIVSCHKDNKRNNKAGKRNNQKQNKKSGAALREDLKKHNELKEKPKRTNQSKGNQITGVGMVNVGNSCYLNATLQALFHVVSFVQCLLLDNTHKNTCGGQGHCLFCAMSKTLDMSRTSYSAFRPQAITSKIEKICGNMRNGQQEDAHEFLTYLLDGMQKSYSIGRNSDLDPIQQIFGGDLISTLRCSDCGKVSENLSPFLDICLDIRNSNSIDEALSSHFDKEILDDYKCESCGVKSVTKQTSIKRPPKSLCIQLSRFTYQGKFDKKITISTKINLSEYVLEESGTPLSYRLASMIIHTGSSAQCGHYTAIALSEDGNYYKYDDEKVDPMLTEDVLTSPGYIMFYELES